MEHAKGSSEAPIVVGSPLKHAQTAADLLPLVYKELRMLAQCRLSQLRPGQTLQPTALVHEAYMRLVGTHDPGWNSSGHFFAAAADAMRNVIVDAARQRAAVKRGGDRPRLSLDQVPELGRPDDKSPDYEELDRALRELEQIDARKSLLVTLRFFGGLSAEQAANVLGVSLPTVERDWRYAKAWLQRRLERDNNPPAPT